MSVSTKNVPPLTYRNFNFENVYFFILIITLKLDQKLISPHPFSAFIKHWYSCRHVALAPQIFLLNISKNILLCIWRIKFLKQAVENQFIRLINSFTRSFLKICHFKNHLVSP